MRTYDVSLWQQPVARMAVQDAGPITLVPTAGAAAVAKMFAVCWSQDERASTAYGEELLAFPVVGRPEVRPIWVQIIAQTYILRLHHGNGAICVCRRP